MKQLTLAVLLVLAVAGASFADPLCDKAKVNLQGTSNADITVDATAGGVSVMAASETRCGAIILNTGDEAMRCAPTTVTVTSTRGAHVAAGSWITLGVESRQAWKCIRETSTSTTANVIEATQ